MRPQTTSNYSGVHCSHSHSDQSFDWPMGLLIQSPKLSKFLASISLRGNGGVIQGFDCDEGGPGALCPALFLQPPWLQIGRREP